MGSASYRISPLQILRTQTRRRSQRRCWRLFLRRYVNITSSSPFELKLTTHCRSMRLLKITNMPPMRQESSKSTRTCMYISRTLQSSMTSRLGTLKAQLSQLPSGSHSFFHAQSAIFAILDRCLYLLPFTCRVQYGIRKGKG